MTNSGHRVDQNHPWAHISHHSAHILAHRGGIAMYLTIFARWLGIPMRAPFETKVRIPGKSLTLCAKRSLRGVRAIVMDSAAVYPYHPINHLLLTSYFVHSLLRFYFFISPFVWGFGKFIKRKTQPSNMKTVGISLCCPTRIRT